MTDKECVWQNRAYVWFLTVLPVVDQIEKGEIDMSQDNPGILHDATNSWNGYNHQGKIALFYAVDRITELLQGADNRKSGVDSLEKYFLEVEYTEDFSIGTFDEAGNRLYLTVHQVKDRQDVGLAKYESALQGLAVNLIRHPEAEGAFLHTTTQVSTSTKYGDFYETLSHYVKNVVWIDEQKQKAESSAKKKIKTLEENPKFTERAREARKQEILANLGAEQAQLEQMREKLLDLAGKDTALSKIRMFNYGTDEKGPFHCEKEEAKKYLKRSLENFYRMHNPDKEFMSGEAYVDKSYWYILEKLNDHVVFRSRNYSKTDVKRYLLLSEVYNWLTSDEIENMDEGYHIYYIKEAYYEYLNQFCNRCNNWDRCEECQASHFKKQLRSMKSPELKRFLFQTNPDVPHRVGPGHNHKFLQGNRIQNPFWYGLRTIPQKPEGFPEFITAKYVGRDKQTYLLTTLAVSADELFPEETINVICTEIYRNQKERDLNLEGGCLLSRGVDVKSLRDRVQSIAPDLICGDSNNILFDDPISIVPIKTFISTCMCEECEEL